MAYLTGNARGSAAPWSNPASPAVPDAVHAGGDGACVVQVHIHIHIHTHTHTYTNTHTHTHTPTHTHTHTHPTHTDTQTQTHPQTHRHTYTDTHTHTQIQTQTHTYRHTDTHTDTGTPPCTIQTHAQTQIQTLAPLPVRQTLRSHAWRTSQGGGLCSRAAPSAYTPNAADGKYGPSHTNCMGELGIDFHTAPPIQTVWENWVSTFIRPLPYKLYGRIGY
jgi:hypothetical protein